MYHVYHFWVHFLLSWKRRCKHKRKKGLASHHWALGHSPRDFNSSHVSIPELPLSWFNEKTLEITCQMINIYIYINV